MLKYLIGIELDGRQAVSESAKVQQAFARIGQKLSGALTAVLSFAAVRAITRHIRQVIDWGSEINDLAARMNVSTETVQRWNYAAEQTGITIEDIATSFRYVQQRMAEAMEGSSEAVKAFAQFGLTVSDIQRMKPEEVFTEIARRFRLLPENVSKTDAAITLFGRSADRLFTALREGFDQAISEAERFGVILQDKTIKQLDSAADKWVLFKAQLRAFFSEGLVGKISSAILDALNNLLYVVRGRPRHLRRLSLQELRETSGMSAPEFYDWLESTSGKQSGAQVEQRELMKQQLKALQDLNEQIRRKL